MTFLLNISTKGRHLRPRPFVTIFPHHCQGAPSFNWYSKTLYLHYRQQSLPHYFAKIAYFCARLRTSSKKPLIASSEQSKKHHYGTFQHLGSSFPTLFRGQLASLYSKIIENQSRDWQKSALHVLDYFRIHLWHHP